MAYVNISSKPIKLIEGWLQHKNSQETKWTSYWCVLKDFVIYIFKNEDTSRDNHIGVLSIGSDTQVKIGDSDSKKGYRFDLYTAKKLNKFKTTKFIERELWKAYLVGLTEGDITDSFDLTADQIQKVRNDIHRVMSGSSRPPLPVSPRQAHDNISGFSSPDNSISSIFPSTGSSTQLDDGGPTIRHRFWPNPDKTDIPSWFFTSITRDTAESILTTGRDFGNTLLRESVTFRDTGSYVITKKMEHHVRGPPFNHFEVIRVAEGFKINVENAHKTMTCLSEVMDYFVRMSGCSVTRPMVTNDLKVLGLDIPDYHTKIIRKSKPNAESGEDDIDYPEKDYEDPVSPSYPPASSKTLSQSSKLPKGFPGDSKYGATFHSGQVRNRQRLDDAHLRQRMSAGSVMNELDSTLNQFSHSQSVHPRINRQPSSETEILDGLGAAPPPPCAGTGRRTSDCGIEAPPHPRFQSRAKSVPVLQIPPNLDQEVRLSNQPPRLVKPAQTPPRVLPKPPIEQEDEQATVSPFLREIQTRKNALKTEENKKPLTSYNHRNTWHSGRRPMARSSSTSSAPTCDQFYQPIDDSSYASRDRRYSESNDNDDYYDDAVGLTLTGVTFEDIQSTQQTDQTDQVDETGAMDKATLKKKLNMMLAGVGGGVGGGGGGGGVGGGVSVGRPAPGPTSPRTQPLPPLPHPPPPEEEEFDEIIYEPLD